MFCKKGILRNFPKFTGEHLCQSLFFNKVDSETLAQMFSCEFYDFANTCRTTSMAASEVKVFRGLGESFSLWGLSLRRKLFATNESWTKRAPRLNLTSIIALYDKWKSYEHVFQECSI